MSFDNRRARAEEKLKIAIQSLQKTISKDKDPLLDDLDFATFDNIESAELGAKEIEAAIERVLEKRTQTKEFERNNRLQRFKYTSKKWFQASYPFASLCLTIAKLGSNIPVLNPYGLLFGGLEVLLAIAFQESQRTEELETTLEFLFGTMNRIQLVRKIPVDMDDAQIDDLQCKALDLCRSVLEFLDLSIRTLKNSFARNLANGVFTGSKEFRDAKTSIESTVDQFNSTLRDLGLVANWETLTRVRHQGKVLDGLAVSIRDIHRKLDIKPTNSDLLTEPLNQVFKFLSLRDGDWNWMTRYGELIDGATRQELIDWIFPGDVHGKHAAIVSKRVEGSGKWFLQHPVFRDWVSGNSPNILFCPGIVGTGKTVITSIVIDELEKTISTDEMRGLAYVYIDYKDQLQQSTASIVSSFLKQLAEMGSGSVRTEFSVDCSILYRNECLETNSKKAT